MCYDLQVFSCLDPGPELFRLLPQEKLKRRGADFAIDGNAWQATFHVDLIESEDVPQSVFREAPGIQYVLQITFEGRVPVRQHTQIMRLAKRLARMCKGVLVDPQSDTIQVGSGVKRVDLACISDDQPTLKLNWWFEDAASFKQVGYRRFVKTLEAYAPDALPRRYDLSEPPQFKLAEHGRDHFLNFFHQSLLDSNTLVWYASRPFKYVFVSLPPKVGGTRQGYRCCRIKLQLEAGILQFAGWPFLVRRLWLAVSQVVLPFFAEIRQGLSPIRGWWWTGIPESLGIAAMVGPPYDQLWPEFLAHSDEFPPNLRFAEALDSGKPLPMSPPTEIMQPAQPTLPERPLSGSEIMEFITSPRVRYPRVWPFSEPFG